MSTPEPRSDEEIVARVDALMAERHEIEHRAPGVGLSDDDAARLRQIEVERDRLWDLKRRRQAARDAGQDPDTAHEQDASTVENYRQ